MDELFANWEAEDGESDEESRRKIEEEEEEARRKKAKEVEEIKRKRKEARERDEERWFQKSQKIEAPTLAEILNRKAIMVDREDQKEFRENIPRVVEHFKTYGDSDFREKMKAFTELPQLIRFIHCCHVKIVNDKEKENLKTFHNFLVEYHKEVVEALFEMTSIPKDTKLTIVVSGNVFSDAFERAEKKELNQKGLDDFLLKAERERKKQEELRDAAVVQLTRDVADIGVSQRLARQLVDHSIDIIENPTRDTSPPRPIKIDQSDLDLLMEHLADLRVDEATRNGTTHPVKSEDVDMTATAPNEDDDLSFLDEILGPADETGGRTGGYRGGICEPKEEIEEPAEEDNEVVEEMEEVQIIEDDEIIVIDPLEMENPTWIKTLDYDKVPKSNHFGQTEFEEGDEENWKEQRLMDKHKRKMINTKTREGYKTVSFVPFESELNKMRIFAEANAHFFWSPDDGPQTDHVDMTLKDGWKTIISTPGGWVPYRFERRFIDSLALNKESRNAQSLTQPLLYNDWIYHFHGNLLGRFWFVRNPEDTQEYPFEKRKRMGLLRQYSMEELVDLYRFDIDAIYITMRRGFHRMISGKRKHEVDPNYDSPMDPALKGLGGEVKSVLLLTDWRLAHLAPTAAMNAHVKYMPTNLGKVFFESMGEYLRELLTNPHIEISTIIFAFGGSPRFKKEDFIRFFKALTIHTLKRVDVFWTAQDWWDGLTPNEKQMEELVDFNNCVKGMFAAMAKTGHKNYQWWNPREHIDIEVPVVGSTPDIKKLEPLYLAYVAHFYENWNCYFHSFFFFCRERPTTKGYMENDSLTPHRC